MMLTALASREVEEEQRTELGGGNKDGNGRRRRRREEEEEDEFFLSLLSFSRASLSRRAAHGDPVTTRAGPDCPAKVTPTLLSGSAFGPLPRSRSCSRRCCDLRIVRVQGLRDLAAWSSLLLLPPSPSSLSAATSASVDCLDHCFFLLSQAGFRLLL